MGEYVRGLETWVYSGKEDIRRGLVELHGLYGEDPVYI